MAKIIVRKITKKKKATATPMLAKPLEEEKLKKVKKPKRKITK